MARKKKMVWEYTLKWTNHDGVRRTKAWLLGAEDDPPPETRAIVREFGVFGSYKRIKEE